jgi:hypothetical protein
MSYLAHRRKAFRFKPADIAGLDLWLDASDNSTVLDATDAEASDDEAVKTWQDKSGNANHAVQATVANQPLRRAAEVNGLDALDLDGTNHYMLGTSDLTPRQTDEKTIFCVGVCDDLASSGNRNTLIDLYENDTAATGESGALAAEISYRCSGRTWISTTPATQSAASIVTLSHDGQTNIEDAITMWLNGSAVTKTSGTDGALVDATGVYYVGTVGVSLGQNYNGRICEIIVYDSELSTADREAVETYLANKWGITLS